MKPVCGLNDIGVTRTRGIGTPGATMVCWSTEGGVNPLQLSWNGGGTLSRQKEQSGKMLSAPTGNGWVAAVRWSASCGTGRSSIGWSGSPVSISSATTEAVNRLSPARTSPPNIGTGFPVEKYTIPRSGSTVPTSQTPPPPSSQVFESCGQVSWPNAPERGTTKNVHRVSPVAASRATMRPCPPLSPLATPTKTVPCAYTGAVVTVSPNCCGTLPTDSAHTSSPVSWRSAATCEVRSPTNTRSSPSPTPCHDGTICSSVLGGCQRQTVSPVRASIAKMLAPAVK